MVKVLISPAARQDLIEIGDYIALRLHNRAAARSTLARIQKAVMRLEDFPESGSPLHHPSLHIAYRYLVCGNYLIFYHFTDATVQIDRVLYGRRDYLSLLFGDQLEDTE